MSTIKTFPQAPYHDDYSQDKDYLRVLFKPGVGVQTREMNQLQTIQQNQVSRFANSFFENGARVVRGEASVGNNFTFITVTAQLARNKDQYKNLSIANVAGVTAQIIKVVDAVGADACTVYIQYTKSTTTANTFSVGNILTITHSDATTEAATVALTGTGALYTIDEGVYYIQGQFVNVEADSIVLSKYVPLTTGELSVGFIVSDSVVTADTDTTLLDNAAGTTNETAPGADRYKLNVLLTIKPTTNVENFIEISRVIDGRIATPATSGEYTTFKKLLADRTFDESGDYVVEDFSLSINEHLQTETQRGVYTALEGGLDSKIVYTIDPGRAYVKGFPVETFSNTNLATNKAQTTSSISDGAISLPYESYIVVDPTGTSAAISIGQTLELKSGGTTVGTAIVRMVNVDTNPTYIRIHVSGFVVFAAGTIDNIVTAGGFTASYISSFVNGKASACVFAAPESFIKTLTGATYEYHLFQQVTNNANTVTVTSADFLSSSVSDYTLVFVKAGAVVSVTPTSMTSTGNTAILTYSGGIDAATTVSVFGRATRTYASVKSKTKTTVTSESVVASGNKLTLAHTDIIRVIEVRQGSVSGPIVTASFHLDNGQRDTMYDFGVLQGTSTGTYYVTYEYFAHGTGDFFASQSYGSDYKSIPYYTSSSGEKMFMGSAIDFRVSKVTSTSTNYSNTSATMFASGDVMVIDFEHYLARRDLICIDNAGVLSVVNGIPSLTPQEPKSPDNALVLYSVLVNPFTFDYRDVSVTKTSSRRYTMSDIGDIEKRIDTLEYYTSLNQAEKDLIDKNYVNTFKSGFIVDNFTSQAVADESNPDLLCGFDLKNKECRPETPSKFVSLNSTASSNIRINNGIATLEYTEVAAVVQDICSDVERIQPYVLFAWEGNVILTPSVDSWVDTQYLPDFVFDSGTLNVTTGARTAPGSAIDSLFDASVGTSTQFVSDSLVSVGASAFIRGRTITITGSGFKPSTRLYVSFDGVSVDQYCANTGGGVIMTTGSGSISFSFSIPATDTVRFRTGNRTLRVSDQPIGSLTNESTSGNAIYSANGLTNFRQNSFAQTRLVSTIPRPPVIFDEGFSTVSSNGRSSFSPDPIAQSFVVPSELGMFVSSVDIFFGPDAATNTFPASVELRNMVNGYPGSFVAAKAIKPASELFGSSNGFTPTRFTFESPVFLEGGKEYAFVVKSDSLTLTIWTSVLGNRSYQATDGVVPTGQIISKQAFLGSMFRSQNDRTWTAEQTRDVKFSVNRASFVSSGSLTLKNIKPSYEARNNEYNQYLVDAIKFVTGSPVATVIHPNNGFKNADVVTFSRDATTPTTIAGITTSLIFGVPLTVSSVKIDSYDVTFGANATSSILAGGVMYATSKVMFAEAMLSIDNVIVNGTKLTYDLSTKDYNTNVQSLATSKANGDIIKFGTLQTVGASGDSSVVSTVGFSSESNFVSPLIDLHKSGLIAINNRIDSTDLAQYVQKPITLLTPANKFTTYISANVPNASNIELWYRTGLDSIQASPWIKVAVPTSGIKTSSLTDFTDWQFDGQTTTDFYSIQVKVVMNTSNPASIPRMKNVRTIAVKSV
jgi:hypothetical protein